jgi:hypothetical protein
MVSIMCRVPVVMSIHYLKAIYSSSNCKIRNVLDKTSLVEVSLAWLIGKSYDFAVCRIVQGFFSGGMRLEMRFGIRR